MEEIIKPNLYQVAWKYCNYLWLVTARKSFGSKARDSKQEIFELVPKKRHWNPFTKLLKRSDSMTWNWPQPCTGTNYNNNNNMMMMNCAMKNGIDFERSRNRGKQ